MSILVSWDTCEIALDRAKDLVEMGEYDDEEAAFEDACGDSDLYVLEWDDMLSILQDELDRHDPKGHGMWLVDAANMGWRHRSGQKVVDAGDASKFLRAILPDTDCTFRIEEGATPDELVIVNYHHDAPTGETYRARPINRELYENDSEVRLAYCGWRYKHIGGRWRALTLLPTVGIEAQACPAAA